jgi:peptide/nickel transport system permease protein
MTVATTDSPPLPRPRSARRTSLGLASVASGLLLAVVATAPLLPGHLLQVDPGTRNLPPGAEALFGTDMLGRDIAARTLAALSNSIWTGLLAGALSTAIAVGLGLAAASSRLADRIVGILTELALGLPHFVLLIMITYAAGGGADAVVLAVALTHWPRLSRLLRLEAQTVARSDYVAISRALGRSRLWIARHHLGPHLIPQVLTGFVLIFPHAILHEAGLSFIGLGIEPHLPSIGVMLAESLRGVMAGHWWVALFPGLALLVVAMTFEGLGESLRRATDPREGVA